MNLPVSLRLPQSLWLTLIDHLFQGDEKEHGAVVAVSTLQTSSGCRLLGRRLFIAKDGTDYLENLETDTYTLTASFVRSSIVKCRDAGLSYLAVHNHGGSDYVAFSDTDMRSHERGYPALLDMLKGNGIVGALVIAENAVAGDIWFSKENRSKLDRTVVIGKSQRIISPKISEITNGDETYDRQVKIFGEKGQAILRNQKVGIVGLGGIGCLVNQYLAKLGVGHIVAIDEDEIERSNLSRVVGANQDDMHTQPSGHGILKVKIAERVAREANSSITFSAVPEKVQNPNAVKELLDCDAIFLAADTHTARLVVNAVCHQYLIPVWQVGSKVQTNGEVFSVVRRLIPGMACMTCGSPYLIDSARLADEAAGNSRTTYVENVSAPSVITLNGIGAALATNDYLLYSTGYVPYKRSPSSLADTDERIEWIKHFPLTNKTQRDIPADDPECRICQRSLGAGQTIDLPGLTLPKQPKAFQHDERDSGESFLQRVAAVCRKIIHAPAKMFKSSKLNSHG